MATLCKNCGAGLNYDPKSKKMFCSSCGSFFRAEEVEAYAKDLLEKIEPQPYAKVQEENEDDFEYMDCYVYSCPSCGGEIIINGTEASTNCIFCGNNNVIFNRIIKERKPQEIVPFSITKEEALECIHKKIDKGLFVPGAVKRFKPEHVRGIYIPYWVVTVEHSDAAVIEGDDGRGKYKVYYGRAGTMTLDNLPLDASVMLSNESSTKLEPYNLLASKPFDEDYLLGYYSDISDVTFGEIKDEAFERTTKYFNSFLLGDVKGSAKRIIKNDPYTILRYDKLRYTMLPAWFVTFNYEGQHHTILVNGQTGKVVCGLPWNRKLFKTLIAVTGSILTVGTFLLLHPYLKDIFSYESIGSDEIKMVMMLILIGLVLIAGGIGSLQVVKKSLSLTQSGRTFDFVKKRQG